MFVQMSVQYEEDLQCNADSLRPSLIITVQFFDIPRPVSTV